MPAKLGEVEEVNLDDVRAVFDGIEVGFCFLYYYLWFCFSSKGKQLGLCILCTKTYNLEHYLNLPESAPPYRREYFRMKQMA